MVQFLIDAFDGHTFFMTLLRLDVSFAMMPRVASHSRLNSNRVLRPKPKKSSAGGFEAQTTKPLGEAYPLCLLHNLDMYHYRLWPPDHQVFQRLHLTWLIVVLTWSTRFTPPLVLLLVNVPKCQPPMVSLSSLLVPHSKPLVHPSPLPVHRHDTSLLDLLHSRRPSLCSTPTHHKPRDMHNATHAMNSL